MTNYETLLAQLREFGMDKKWAKMFVKKLADDEKAFPVDDTTRRWALSRGFFPGRVELYGLTEDNYQQYLPDFSYFMIHPINHHFKIWVNDKLTLKYVLNSNGCEDTMPEYYLYIENNGNYTYLMDAGNTVPRDKDYIFNLLKEKGALALKPNSGTSGGRGFMKVEYKQGRICENNRQIEKADFDRIVSELRNYTVTEYVYQHDHLAEIWPLSECTLRVIMVKLPYETPYQPAGWQCVISFARFGTAISGGTSNLSSGGVGVGFDYQTGQLQDIGLRYKKFCPDGNWQCVQHPDTHKAWRGMRLPHWEFVKGKIEHICQHVLSLDYLGFDVIITPQGMKLCEINTHPAADYAQIMCGPILADANARRFYESHGLFSVETEKFYEMYCRSQE